MSEQLGNFDPDTLSQLDRRAAARLALGSQYRKEQSDER